MESELQRLLCQIDDEFNAAYNALHGLSSGAARHEFIIIRMENVDRCRVELEKLVGKEEAVRLIIQNSKMGGGHESRD